MIKARVGAALADAPSRFRSLSDPESLQQLVRNVREGVYITDAAGRILDANPAMVALMGFRTVRQLRDHSARNLIVDPQRRAAELELLERDGFVREFEQELIRRDGTRVTVLDTTYVVDDAATGERFYHGIVVDISARKEQENQLRDMCIRDPLTGAYNRRQLQELEQKFREERVRSWGCIYIDIDHFKEVNDRYGHDAGDLLLRRMASFLTRKVRSEECVIRLGGDEFLVVLAGASAEHTAQVARRLQEEGTGSAPVAFSLGWASRQGGERFPATVTRADQQLLRVRVESRGPHNQRRVAAG